MATATPIERGGRVIPTLPVRRFTVSEYHRLSEVGILTKADRVELLNGWIVPKMTTNPPHASALTKLQSRMARLLPDEYVLRTQQPISLPRLDSEPEPDEVVARGPENRYDEAHPGTTEILLIVEVADSTLSEDRGEKLRIYASAHLAVYWIVNLVESRVEVYTHPRGGKNPAYRQMDVYGDEDVILFTINGSQLGTIRVRELLP
jgi:Putative restriction endonuclease